MTPTKVKNIRVPLPDGTPLTSKITVVRLLSDIGGSSLTYLAKDINGRTLVLKESYPQYTQTPLVREGYKLVFDGDTDELEGFEEEYKNSEILCSEGDTNSIFFFEYRDITDEVLAQDEFSKSAARYMTVATVSGDTLREIHEKNPEIDLKTALTYTRSRASFNRTFSYSTRPFAIISRCSANFPKMRSKALYAFRDFPS